MHQARLSIHLDEIAAEIDPRIYSGFIEHLGRAIYSGIYEPEHPTADEFGMRADVAELVRGLNVPLIRYPGGNFVSGYHWEHGVGPLESRPNRLDLAWRTLEPNLVGINEFIHWTRTVGSEPMMAVNLGTRGIDAACNLLEYCNFPEGSYWSDLRREHGYEEPHGVPIWCLGNEMDGPWQIGQKTATEYGRLAAETGKAMRLIDSSIELVACGSSHPRMPTYPDWEETVLEQVYETADYLSLHIYLRDEVGVEDLLVQSAEMDQYIKDVIAACDLAKAKQRSSRTMMLSFDEWNVWYHARPEDRRIMRDEPWQVGPPLSEETYTVADAVAVGSMMLTLLRHADRIKIACLAQLVNALAPIMTVAGGSVWKQTTFYPFQHASAFGRGSLLYSHLESAQMDTARYGPLPMVETIATTDEVDGTVTLFAVNRSIDQPVELRALLLGTRQLKLTEWIQLSSSDPLARNSAQYPENVAPAAVTGYDVIGAQIDVPLPPVSWNVLRFANVD